MMTGQHVPLAAGLFQGGQMVETLLDALKMAQHNAPRVTAFFMQNISKRLAQRLEMEVEAHPEVKPRDGEAAQAEVVRAARELAQAGEIKLVEVDEDE